MLHSDEFRKKEVINIRTAEKLGFIRDIDVCFESGKIRSIIVPSGNFFLRLFSRRSDYIIPWSCIVKIGEEVVLVDYTNSANIISDT